MNREVRARLRWVELYQKTGNAGLVCKRCGISRPTLRKWVARFEENGLEGLSSQSRKPKRSPATKVNAEIESWILALRLKRKLGARRIQNELQRLHDCPLSLATIHKVLSRHKVKPLKRRRRKKEYRRYSRPIPGDRIQMDVCKIAPGIYQFTAIDDCTRFRVLGIYPRRSAVQTIHFLDRVIEEMPFPIQRIQTDRGREFFAEKVQRQLMALQIKFRPIKPASPHLNGKVERSQQTDLQEFWSSINLAVEDLEDRLAEWQHYYNWERGHGSLGGKSPMERYFELISQTPYWDDIYDAYQPERERIREPDYQLDLKIGRLKESL